MFLRSGAMLAIFSYFLWGITPLFYRLLPGVQPLELLSQRVLWSIPLLLFARFFLKNRTRINAVWADKRSLLLCLLSTSVMAISWCTFTYSMTHDLVLEASMGYFITPLFSILLGVIFLHERLKPAEKTALIFVCAGVGYQLYQYGSLPKLALMMGSAFALYGFIRKFIRYDLTTSLLIESLWLLPVAIVLYFWLENSGAGTFSTADTFTRICFILTAPVTLLPLLFFTAAVRSTTLTTIGLAQYLEPTIQFLLAVFLFNEHFDAVKGVSFSLIWLGLLFCILSLIRHHRKNTAKAGLGIRPR
ncbi:TPA: EamA family transporter RarD [Morganella morganii]|nr:EamA family transporter RarD [Morganella morganii]